MLVFLKSREPFYKIYLWLTVSGEGKVRVLREVGDLASLIFVDHVAIKTLGGGLGDVLAHCTTLEVGLVDSLLGNELD